MRYGALNCESVAAIQTYIDEEPASDPLVLIGQAGIGKKFAYFAATPGIETIVVDIRTRDFFQMKDLINACCDDGAEEATRNPALYLSVVNSCLNMCATEYRSVYFDNMDNCDRQHALLLNKFIMYCKTNGIPFRFVFAFQDDKAAAEWQFPDEPQRIRFEPASLSDIKAFLRTRIRIRCKNDQAAIEKIAAMANGNAGVCEATLKILADLGVMAENCGKLSLTTPEDIANIPATIGELYDKQLMTMGESRIKALAASLPFEGEVHISVVKHVDWISDATFQYREIHQEQKSILANNRAADPDRLFDHSYRITTPAATRALSEECDRSQVEQHFRTGLAPVLNNSGRSFDSLGFADQYELLIWASGLNAPRVDGGRIGKLAELLFLNGYYARVCELVEGYLHSKNSGGMDWLASKSPSTPELYLESLYNLGQYAETIECFGRLNPQSSRCKYVCAKAHYAIDSLDESKRLATEALGDRTVEADAYLLLSSIANWRNDVGGQNSNITRAAKSLGNAKGFDGVRNVPFTSVPQMRVYQSQLEIRKKYALALKPGKTPIENEVERLCDSIIEKGAASFPPFARIYAEILHNLGTEYIKGAPTREKGLGYLDAANRFFASICDPDRYYTQNSIAMAHCFSKNYEAACKEFAVLKPPDHTPFCVMAVRNNEWMACRKTGDYKGAAKARSAVEAAIRSLLDSNGISGSINGEGIARLGSVRTDVKLQLRHYSINRALDWRSCAEAREWLEIAKSLNCDMSSSSYLVEKLLDLFARSGCSSRRIAQRLRRRKQATAPVNGTVDRWFGDEHVFFCEIMFWG